jgi:hypothetical protein
VQALFWVKTNYIPASPEFAKIYVYYGKSDATTTSSGSQTFVFFDDFANLDSWNIDSGVWQLENNTAKCVEAGLLKHEISYSDGSLIYRAKVSYVEDYWRAMVHYRGSLTDSGFRSGWGYHSGLGGQMAFIDKAYGGWRLIAFDTKVWDVNTWYVAEASFFAGSHRFEFNSDGSPIYALGYSSPSIGSYIGIQGDTQNSEYPVWFDWIAFRQYVDPEPSHGIWYPEETSNLVLVYLNPSATLAGVNESFSLDVKVANITDLYSWEFKLFYPNTLLNAIDVLEGTFLKSSGFTLWFDNSNPGYNVTYGLVHVGASLTGEIPGVNGSGVIATIDFRALAVGSSQLDLQDTILLDSFANGIPYNTYGGSVTVGRHDVAVLSVKSDKDVVGNSALCAMNIDVTVQNQGTFFESFSVTLYANTTAINATVVSLDAGKSTVLRFIWRPVGVPKGNYKLGASASVVPGEVDVEDNTLYNETVIGVSMAGDLTGQSNWPDGTVNIKDASLLASAWGSNYGEPRYKSNCDINDDGTINIRDVVVLARNWGKIDP